MPTPFPRRGLTGPILATGLGAFLLMSSAFAAQDEVLKEIETAVEAYQEKDYRTALEGLRFATAKIQKLLDAEYVKLLPEPLEGWTADKPKVQSAAVAIMGGGTTLKRTYRKGEQKVVIEIVANSPMVGMMAAAIQNPAMLSAQGMEPYRYKRLRGMKKTKGDRIEIQLLMAGKVLITLQGRRLPDEGPLEAYLEALDLGALRDAFL
jgi:hypothetical protein